MPQSALGISSRSEYGDINSLKANQLIDLIVQKHLAARAGPHTDIRLGNKDTGLFSWAARKGLPQPGIKHLAVQQPLHSHEYGQFEGEIPQGQYGAGKVTKEREGQVLITDIGPDKIHFTTASDRYPERYALIKPKNQKDPKHWLLLNTTPNKPMPYAKEHMKLIPTEQAEEVLGNLKPGASAQAKVDGALTLTKLMKHSPEVQSYRTSKVTGNPITHTERMFQGAAPKTEYPKGIAGSVLRGELYGIREGQTIPPQELGGLLNSALAKSINTQRERGVDLKNMIFDIAQMGKKPITTETPYPERRQMIEQVIKHLPSNKFHVAEEANTPDAALALWKKIQAGKHDLTTEGMVIHPNTGPAQKLKIRPESDVHIAGTFPGEGKYTGLGAGGFTYSHEPGGSVVGRVGTGLSDELRRSLHQTPQEYLGRIARVASQGKYPGTGALRAPSLISLHEG